jgi:hypothetical protein
MEDPRGDRRHRRPRTVQQVRTRRSEHLFKSCTASRSSGGIVTMSALSGIAQAC